jgi:hypothetical protein
MAATRNRPSSLPISQWPEFVKNEYVKGRDLRKTPIVGEEQVRIGMRTVAT